MLSLPPCAPMQVELCTCMQAVQGHDPYLYFVGKGRVCRREAGRPCIKGSPTIPTSRLVHNRVSLPGGLEQWVYIVLVAEKSSR